LRNDISEWLSTDMTTKNLFIATCGAASFGLCTILSFGCAEAAIITSTIPEFNGSSFSSDEPFPQPPVNIGIFSYTIPTGEEIVSAVISGTFGNSVVPNSSGLNLFVDSFQVASCARFDPLCYFGSIPTPWSFSFPASAFSFLTDNSMTLTATATQTSEFVIRLGETRLTIETAPIASVPEPTSVLALLVIVALGGSSALKRNLS